MATLIAPVAPPVLTTESCRRCGGSGQYSWCALHGTTCFGCGGSGQVLDAASAQYVSGLPTLAAAQVGDVLHQGGRQLWRVDAITWAAVGARNRQGIRINQVVSCRAVDSPHLIRKFGRAVRETCSMMQEDGPCTDCPNGAHSRSQGGPWSHLVLVTPAMAGQPTDLSALDRSGAALVAYVAAGAALIAAEQDETAAAIRLEEVRAALAEAEHAWHDRRAARLEAEAAHVARRTALR